MDESEPLPRRGYGCADVITALFILASIFVVSITVLLLSNPRTPFNPFPPPTPVERIIYVTETPLPTLLETTDLDRESLDALAGGNAPRSLPEGVVRVSAVLPEHQAFIVKKWDEAARSKLRKPS